MDDAGATASQNDGCDRDTEEGLRRQPGAATGCHKGQEKGGDGGHVQAGRGQEWWKLPPRPTPSIAKGGNKAGVKKKDTINKSTSGPGAVRLMVPVQKTLIGFGRMDDDRHSRPRSSMPSSSYSSLWKPPFDAQDHGYMLRKDGTLWYKTRHDEWHPATGTDLWPEGVL